MKSRTYGMWWGTAIEAPDPVWPPAAGEQRPMVHFDFQVGDVDSAVAEAVALGASLASAQPQENVR